MKYLAFVGKHILLGICMFFRFITDFFALVFKRKKENDISYEEVKISDNKAYYMEISKDEFAPKVKYINNQTIRHYAKVHKDEIIINAGLFNLYNGKPNGQLIINHKVLHKNYILDDNGAALSDFECHPLVIDENNDLKVLSYNRKGKENKAEEIAKNHPFAVTGWGTMIKDGAATDFISQEIVWGKDRKIRQITGQLKNKNYFVLSCDDAFYKDIYEFLSGKEVDFAYSLDGGRSTRLYINGNQVNAKSRRSYIPVIITFIRK